MPAWLNRNILNNEILPPHINYAIYRNNHTDGYGGILIGIKSCILSELVYTLPHLKVCTLLYCIFPRTVATILLICVYRPLKTWCILPI